jgi:hypothetical protein
MHRNVGTHEGKDEWEEGVGIEKDEAAKLEHAEQLTDEQVGRLVQQARSRTKVACSQAAPSARTSGSSSSGRGRGRVEDANNMLALL